MQIVIIDNYDSFTYNLVQAFESLGAGVTVWRNDAFSLADLRHFDRLVLSPGPGVPAEAGLLLDVVREYAAVKPILGICLGEQAIGQVYGARLVNLPAVFHGVQTPAEIIEPDYVFEGLPRRIQVGRYHSWVVDRASLPACLEVTAVSPEGYVMALRHREYDVRGVQFHPESILTPCGVEMLRNWLFHNV